MQEVNLHKAKGIYQYQRFNCEFSEREFRKMIEEAVRIRQRKNII